MNVNMKIHKFEVRKVGFSYSDSWVAILSFKSTSGFVTFDPSFEILITLLILKIEIWDFHIWIPERSCFHLETTSGFVTSDRRFEMIINLFILKISSILQHVA